MNNISHTMHDRTPYTYLIGWSKLNIWYYGVRYAKYCHPSDLFNNTQFSNKQYRTSSKHVKNFLLLHGLPDIIQIRKTFITIIKAKNHEDKVLRRLKVGNKAYFLNVKADSFKNLDITKVNHHTGLNNSIHTTLSTEEGRKEFSRKVSEGMKKGVKPNTEKNLKYLKSDKNPGKNKSKETCEKLSIAQKKRMSNMENRRFGEKHHYFGKHLSQHQKDMLKISMSNTRHNEKFYCDKCDKHIKTTANFHRHLKAIHKIEDFEDRQIICRSSKI